MQRQVEATSVRRKSLKPSILREKMKRRRRLSRMNQAMAAISVPPGSATHPSSLDLSSWLPYWRITIGDVVFDSGWKADSDKFQVLNNRIETPPVFAENCSFQVANQGFGNEVLGDASFKIMNEEKFFEFIPLLRLNNSALIEMGWTTSLNRKITPDGWDPKAAYSDAMSFRSMLNVIANEVAYDTTTGTWQVTVKFQGYADYLLSSLHTNDLCIDDGEGGGFQGWVAQNIFLSNGEAVANSDYLTAAEPGSGGQAKDVKITSEGIVATMNALMNVLDESNESIAAIGARKKLYKSGDEDGAVAFDAIPVFSCDEAIINDTMPLANFKPYIQDEKKRKLRISDAMSGISDQFTTDNKLDEGSANVRDKTGKRYYWMTQWVDDPNEEEDRRIRMIKLTSVGTESDLQNPDDIGPLTIGRNFSWLKALSLSQTTDPVITTKAFADESKIEGKETDQPSDKGNVAAEGSAEQAPIPAKEIVLYPFSANVTIMGLTGWRLFQKVNLQGLGGEDLYDGLYIIGGIKYSADLNGWDTQLTLSPDVSSGSFPNTAAILARHLPNQATGKSDSSTGPAGKYEDKEYSES